MDIEKVGKAIAYLRKRAGYTQKELAERVGISNKAVSKWERGQGLPEIGYLRKLSILLDTDSDSLLAGDVAHHKKGWKGIIVLAYNSDGIGAGTMIYDKPLINYLFSYFLLVGIKEIFVVCADPKDSVYLQSNFGSGEDYGIQIRIITDSFRTAVDAARELIDGDDNIMLVYGRTILYGVDQTRFFQKAMIDRSHLTIMTLPKKKSKASINVDVDKRVVTEQDSVIRTQYDFSEIPIMFFPADLLKDIARAASIEDYVEEQKLVGNAYIEMLDRGFVEIEVDDWNSVQDASIFIRIVQEKCGMNIYCLEEVAWRRGMISLAKLKSLGEDKAGTEYGEYILDLYENLRKRIKEA